MIKLLYNEKTLIGRLHQYFLIYFETFSVPKTDTLTLLVSVWFLHPMDIYSVFIQKFSKNIPSVGNQTYKMNL